MRHGFGAIVIGGLVLGACDSVAPACTRELATRSVPRDTTIRVGQTFTPSFQFMSCGGRQVVRDALSFASSDSTVLTVDRFTGRTTGRAPGAASIQVTGATYGGPFPIAVTVAP